MSNPTKQFVVLRTTHFNGGTLEVDRFFGIFASQEDALARSESLYESVNTNVALRGFSFTFYVKEVLV